MSAVNNCVNLHSESLQTAVAKMTELATKEIVLEKSDAKAVLQADRDCLSELHPDSMQELGFLGEFLRVDISSVDDLEEKVEKLAGRYSYLHEGLLELFAENQKELYQRLSALNRAFEDALNAPEFPPAESTKAEPVGKLVINIRGGKLIIIEYCDGTIRVEIAKDGEYGMTNAELGRGGSESSALLEQLAVTPAIITKSAINKN